jgi:murein DD-endopeptidase MepM/ murein hydrolase activator NlpD
MKEQNEQKEKEKKNWKKWFKDERRFYLLTAIGCALALTAIIVVAVAISGDKTNEPQVDSGNNGDNVVVIPPKDDEQQVGGNENEDQQPVVKPDEGMVSPVANMNVVNDYGFYHNTTLNWFYEHAGIDFLADAGTEVMAVDAGTVESIYKDDILSGTEIVIAHGDGLKTVYRFVTEVEGLKVGDSVEKGEVIATIAEASGNEYKDGAHLHFEVHKEGVNVDPNVYLTLEEK